MKIIRWTAFPGALLAGGLFSGFALAYEWLAPAAIPLAVTFGALLLALSLERWLPRRGLLPERGETATDLGWLVLNGVVSQPVAEAAIAAIAIVLAPDGGLVSGMHVVVQVAVGLLVFELGTYAAHRAAHEVPWLWKLHAVHHAPTTMRALNNPRLHPAELLVRTVVTNLPALLLGVSPVAFAWLAAVRGVHLWFGHIDADLRYGPLSRVLNTASVHRWHHADSVEEGGMANYGGMFVLFDQLLGTFRLPPEEAEPTGMGLIGVPKYPRHRLWRSLVAPICWRRCTDDMV